MTEPGAPSPFGQLLREWRKHRGASQLRLATEAGITPRHLSFLETGRSRPSRAMVIRLAETLDVPLRERNVLLAAAGFSSLYHESRLGTSELAQVERVLDFLLERQQPYPAYLVDRCWTLLRSNAAGQRAFAGFADAAEPWQERPLNLLWLTCHPEGLRRWTVNADEVVRWSVARLRRESAVALHDEALADLLQRVTTLPGVDEACIAGPAPPAPAPVLPLHLKRNDLELRLFSAITTLGTPQDVTLQDLRIESFLPADDATDAALRRLAG